MAKKIISLLFIISCFGILVALMILNSDLSPTTTGDLLIKLGKSIFYGAGALAIVFFVLLFTPRAFNAWKKFAIWFVPLAALLFIFYQEPGSGDLFSPYPEQIYQWVSMLYVAISIVIIAIKYLFFKDNG